MANSWSECVTCVTLEINVLWLVLVLLWCWTLRVALARTCIVLWDLCRVGVLSVTVVMGSAVALTQLCVVCGNH